jgi:hypothetical protein
MGRKLVMFLGLAIVTLMFLSTCAWADSIVINSLGATWTNNPDVVVVYGTTLGTQYRLSNSFFMSVDPWYPVTYWMGTIAWRLDDSWDGVKYVYAEFRRGPTDTYPTKCSAHINLDTTPPHTSTSSVVPTGWVKSANISFYATDSGSGVDYTEYRIDDGAWTRLNSSCFVTAPSGTKVTRTVYYRSVDRAGNVEASQNVKVNIDNSDPTPTPTPTPTKDTTPPSTTVSGSGSGWHNHPVTLSFTASDPGSNASGVSQTLYRVDAGAFLSGQSVTVPAPAGGAGDGVHTVSYYSVDKAGNVEATKSMSVRVDTVGPKGKAQNVTVKRGKTCKLWFDVDDSISPKVTLALYVKTRGGFTKARWSWGYNKVLPTGYWWWQKYTCRLRRGTYRIEVRGNDLAGNHQSVVGYATLRVR